MENKQIDSNGIGMLNIILDIDAITPPYYCIAVNWPNIYSAPKTAINVLGEKPHFWRLYPNVKL